MKTDEERIRLLHSRAEELKRKKEEQRMAAWGSVSACLSVLLIILAWKAGSISSPLLNCSYMGSSMLGESAGGYVLVAVIAFLAGVMITVMIQRTRDHKRKKE